jgi:hypothetical protein
VTDWPDFRTARLGQGALYALAGHVVVVLGALLAGLFIKPSSGGGMEDLAAIGLIVVGGEALLGIVCLLTGALMFRRDERERGLGLVAGWLAGLAIVVIIIRSTH